MKTVHFFAFYLHNLPKNTFFAPWSSMNHKIQNLYILMGMGEGILLPLHFLGAQSIFFRCAIYLFQMLIQSTSDVQSVFFRCAISLLQMRNQFSSDFHFHIFEILLLILWWLAPVFMMIYSCFYSDLLLLLWWGGSI